MEEIVLNPQYSNSSSVFAEVRPIDSMRWIKQDDGSVRYLSDTRLLLNQKRLINQLGEDTYNALIQGMTPTRSSYERGKFSDDELFKDIKSRFIQSASEVRAYMSGLMDELDSEVASAKSAEELKLLEQRRSELESAVESFYKNAASAGAVDKPAE